MAATLPQAACIRCQGSGIALTNLESVRSGLLLPLCTACRGAGTLFDPGPNPPFRAAWVVGAKFLVRMTVERRKGGFVELDLDWSPNLPPERGPGRLRPSQRREYEMGRDAALAQHMAEMGGGEFSVIAANDRH
jgi:hypothetical protein